MRTVFDNVKVLGSILPVTKTADFTGTGIDTQGYNEAVLVVAAGDIDTSSSDETYVVNVYESDDNSTYTDTGISVTVTADNDVKVARIAELNVSRKRYLQARLDVGGTTPSFPGTALFLLGGAGSLPVNSD
jgi:hypothetical protein